MSDTFGTTDPAGLPEGSPGTGEGTPTDEAAPPADAGGPAAGGEGAPAPSYLDVDTYGTHLVKFKQGDQDVELPFSEALQGVMRQQDYTRKTQELAEQRRQLAQADALVTMLENDPAKTLRELSEIYDLSPESGFAPVERSESDQRVVELQRQVAAQQQEFARQRIEAEVSALRQQDPNFDVHGTAEFARQNGLTLTMAHTVMSAQRAQEQQREAQAAEQRRQAALAAQVAHQGAGSAKGATQAGSNKPVNSLRDAWELAKLQSK